MAFNIRVELLAGDLLHDISRQRGPVVGICDYGSFEGTQILKPETVRLMHSAQHSFDPRVNAMSLGFYEDSRNGNRIIAHGGDTGYFHSDLHLIPDADTGIFLSYNSTGNNRIKSRSPVFRKFADRYFPAATRETKLAVNTVEAARAVAGSYIATRRTQTSLMHLLALIDQVEVSPTEDGELTISKLNGLNNRPIKWREIEPGVWLNPDDLNGRVVFKRNGSGRWTFVASDVPFMEFQGAAWYQNQHFILAAVSFVLGTFLLSLVLWPVAALIRRHYGVRQAQGAHGAPRA